MKITTYQEALEKVFTIESTRDYSLTRVEDAMKLLGNPLENIKVIHIAGTNGKGSTSKMCFSVLKHVGKKVGAFTQPHLLDLKERFITDEGEITENEFVEFLNKILALGLEFSFFEKAFLISCLLFEKRKVEYAIMEVGFGGLLDSTNVVTPEITAITSIGIDHTKILGNTIEEISFQKAGIIKSGIPIIYNHENLVIKKIAEEKKAPVIFTEKLIDTNLVGEYQKRNAAIAFEICRYLLWEGPRKGELYNTSVEVPLVGTLEQLILEGLQKVEHFGRLQYITENLLIDGAHNEQGLKELKKYLDSLFLPNKSKTSFLNPYSFSGARGKKVGKVQLCFAQKKGKDGSKIMKVFGDEYRDLILVESSNSLMVEKAQTLEEKLLSISSLLTEGFSPLTVKKYTPKEIFELSQKNQSTLYIVFGSLYMIGEFLQFSKK